MRRAILAGTVLAALIGSGAFAQAPAAAPGAAPAPSPAAATQRGRMVSCNADAKTQGLRGAERKTFMSGCLKGEPPETAAVAPATAAPAGTAAPSAAAPAGGRQPTPGQLAARQRIRQCGQEWQADKAAGKIPTGQTWPKYWSACNTRLKSAGKG